MSKKTRNLTNKAGKLMKCDGQMLKKVIEAKGYKCHELSKMLRYCSDYLTTCCRTNKNSDVAAKYLMDYKIFPQMYDLEGEIKVDEPKEVKIDKDEKKYIKSDKKATDELQKKLDMINRNSTYGIPKPYKDAELETGCWAIYSEKDLRDCIKRTISLNSPMPGSCIHLMDVSQLLKRARVNRVPYNIEDMRNDLLVYASNIDTHPEYWVEFVDRLNLVNEGTGIYQRSPFIPTDQDIKRVLNEKYGRLEKDDDHYKSTKEVLNEKYWKLNKDTKFGYGHVPSNPGYTYAGHEITWGLSHLMHAVMDDVKNSIKTDPEFKELIKQAVKEAYEEL
jgi:hypothetical protein